LAPGNAANAAASVAKPRALLLAAVLGVTGG